MKNNRGLGMVLVLFLFIALLGVTEVEAFGCGCGQGQSNHGDPGHDDNSCGNQPGTANDRDGEGGGNWSRPRPVPPTTAVITCNPEDINIGEPVIIAWSCANAVSSAGTNFSTGGALGGALSVFPIQDTTYSLLCSGASTSATASCTVNTNNTTDNNEDNTSTTTVTGEDTTLNPYSTFNTVGGGPNTSWLDCFPQDITQGESIRLRWNCTDSTGSTLTETTSNTTLYTGSQTDGLEIVQPEVGSEYRLSCDGSNQTFSCSIYTTTNPTVNIQASPTLVAQGQTSRITWSSAAATGCTISGPDLSSTAFAGSEIVTILGESIFTIECDGDLTDTVKVRIVPKWEEV